MNHSVCVDCQSRPVTLNGKGDNEVISLSGAVLEVPIPFFCGPVRGGVLHRLGCPSLPGQAICIAVRFTCPVFDGVTEGLQCQRPSGKPWPTMLDGTEIL